jgi:hypothetical protein
MALAGPTVASSPWQPARRSCGRTRSAGYSAAGTSRAYLMSSVAETGAAFDVRNASGRQATGRRSGKSLV